MNLLANYLVWRLLYTFFLFLFLQRVYNIFITKSSNKDYEP